MREVFTVMHFMQERFSGFGYVILAPGEVPTSAETNFGEAWHQKYFDHKFHAIDPVFHFTRRCRGRSSFRILAEKDMATPLYEEAKCFGADSNFISISALGGSTMVFGGVNHDLGEQAAQELHGQCQAAHRAVLLKRVDDLTDAQIDLLDMCEEGLMDKHIACELGVSLSAIAQRKKAVCGKLGVASFRAAVSLYSLKKWSGIIPLL